METASQNVPLKSLIPVIYYKLTVTLDPGSGWAIRQGPRAIDVGTVLCTGNPKEPTTAFGTCGLGIQKRQ